MSAIANACTKLTVFPKTTSLHDVARLANAIAIEARLGWTILVNGIPGDSQGEWLEVSSHESTGASDIVVILKQRITDEYLATIPQHAAIDAQEFAQRLMAIDAHMQKAMAVHNVCPMQ